MQQESLFEGAPERASDDRFETFWALYPSVRRVGKDKARAAFIRLNLTWQQWARLQFMLKVQAASSQWTEHPRFIPHPTTYLNNKRWEDDERAYATLPPTAAEIEVAHRIRKNMRSGCEHALPRCASWRDCIDRIIADNRARQR